MREIVEVGDKVVKINGRAVRRFDFCESLIDGIPELKSKKKTRLTIRTNGRMKTVEMIKE